MDTDPTNWLDDYWQQCQYDDDLTQLANDELAIINYQGEDE